jgi:hypothetical protein
MKTPRITMLPTAQDPPVTILQDDAPIGAEQTAYSYADDDLVSDFSRVRICELQADEILPPAQFKAISRYDYPHNSKFSHRGMDVRLLGYANGTVFHPLLTQSNVTMSTDHIDR